MNKKAQTELDSIKDVIVNTVPVERIYLFGSYARGKQRNDSDIDLYVILSDDAPMRAIDAMTDINEAIYHIKTVPTDILVSKKSHFDVRKTGFTIEREVAEKGTVLYG
jgi:predicted nucleotidyltransferase